MYFIRQVFMFLSFCYITVQDSHIVAMTLFKHKYSHSILFGQLGINNFTMTGLLWIQWCEEKSLKCETEGLDIILAIPFLFLPVFSCKLGHGDACRAPDSPEIDDSSSYSSCHLSTSGVSVLFQSHTEGLLKLKLQMFFSLLKCKCIFCLRTDIVLIS